MSPLTDPIMLGRNDVLTDVIDRMRDGRHTLLLGHPGMGKSRIIEEVYAVMKGRTVLLDPITAKRKRRLNVCMNPDRITPFLIREPAPMSSLVDEMLYALHDRGLLAIPNENPTADEIYLPPSCWPDSCRNMLRKDVKKLYGSARERREAILHSLDHSKRQPVLLMDAIDRISPSMAAFLIALQKKAVLLAATREIRSVDALSVFYKTFGQVHVRPLSEANMRAITRYFIRKFHVQVADQSHYIHELVTRANGNPAALRAMIHDGAGARLVSTNVVRELQMRDDAPYFNMGMIYVFVLVGGTFLRTFLTGTMDADAYILLSTLTIAGFIIFRVFRPFFSFRPQRSTRN